MSGSIGISSAGHCINIDCKKPLTDYEKKRQSKHTTRYFFCIKCRIKGHPKTKFTKVACVSCSAELILTNTHSSLVCRECYKASRTYSARKYSSEKFWKKQLV